VHGEHFEKWFGQVTLALHVRQNQPEQQFFDAPAPDIIRPKDEEEKKPADGTSSKFAQNNSVLRSALAIGLQDKMQKKLSY